MLTARFYPYLLIFNEPGGTSRGVMTERKVWYITLYDKETTVCGIGECAPLPGLSCDDMSSYEKVLTEVCANIEYYINDLTHLDKYPSIKFGVEMAWLDFRHNGKQRWFPSEFTDRKAYLRINGLIWMGTEKEMIRRVDQKLDEGFKTLKFKIGALDFETEYSLIKSLRNNFSENELEIRVDANGAFTEKQALDVMRRLAKLKIHSIEQPVKAGNYDSMARICRNGDIPVVLDEELIGVHGKKERNELLYIISPKYIILKPSLTGGFASCDEWIDLAESKNIGWWITSALESNIGLNAIAQWTFTKSPDIPQGLGTGKVFVNNTPSPIELKGENLFLNPTGLKRESNFINKILNGNF